MIQLLNGSVRDIPLRTDSVHMIVTSPPYWSLRHYEDTTAEIWQNTPSCDHAWVEHKFYHGAPVMKGKTRWQHADGGSPAETPEIYASGLKGEERVLVSHYCTKCGAWLGALGLEPSPQQFVANVVEYARELRRVLRPDGTLWLNLGDSYNGSGGAGGDYNKGGLREGQPRYPGRSVSGLKPKDLVGVPWRVALALQDDGWWLRSEIIWYKPNAMPENVRDRPSRDHEHIFLLSPSQHYFYDTEAVRVPPTNRHKRTVWKVTTKAYKEAHFATFNPDLVEAPILASTSAMGCCPECGAQWERITEREFDGEYNDVEAARQQERMEGVITGGTDKVTLGRTEHVQRITTGWKPGCAHDHEPVPSTVFDPFIGSGSTLLKARELGRHGIGLDVSLSYLTENAKKRLGLAALEEWKKGKDGESDLSGLPMFDMVE